MAEEQIIVDIKVNASEILAAEKAINNLTTSIDSLGKETSKLRAENKSNADTQKDLNKLRVDGKITLEEYKNASAKLTEITTQNNKKISENNIELSKQKNERNANIKLINSESNSRDQLRQKIALLNKEYSHINQSTKEGRARTIELQKELHRLNTELNKGSLAAGNFKDNIGNYGSGISRFGKTLKDIFLTGGIVGGIMMIGNAIKNVIVDSFKLGEEMVGTKMQFEKLNNPTLLDELRKATGGTVSDIELMKAALDADDFKTNLNDLPLYFAYARKEVQETGGSVDDLVGTIINGLGKESPKVLTQLGISTKDFKEELKKTGDYTTALNNILKQRMKEAGTYIETAADVTKRWSTRWENIKTNAGLLISEVLVKISPYIETFVGWVEKAWTYTTTWLVDFINGWIDLYNESLPFRLLVESIATTFSVVWESVKLFFNLMIDSLKNTGSLLAYTFNPANWGEGFSKGLAKILASTGGEIVGDVKKFGKNVGDSFFEGLEASKKGDRKRVSLTDYALGGGSAPADSGGGDGGGGGAGKKSIDEKLKANQELLAQIKQMNIDLLDDENEKAIASVKLWREKEKAKIEASIASKQIINDALEAMEYTYSEKLQEINDKREKAELDKQERLRQLNEDFKEKQLEDKEEMLETTAEDDEYQLEREESMYQYKLDMEEAFQEAKKAIILASEDALGAEILTRYNMLQDEKLNKIREDAKIQEDILKQQLDDGLITETEYQAKIEQLNKDTKNKEAAIVRKQALFTILIDTAVGIVKALSSSYFPLNIINAAIVAGMGALQYALTATRPVPTFAKGTSDIVGIGGSHASGNDVDVWGYSGNQKQYFGKVERGEAMPVIRKSAVNDYMIAKLNGKYDSRQRKYANGSLDITGQTSGINQEIFMANLTSAINNIQIVAKIEDITKQASRKMEIVDNSKV